MDYKDVECRKIVDAICCALESAGYADDDWDETNLVQKSLKDQKVKRYTIDIKMLDSIIKGDLTLETISSQTSGPSTGNMANQLEDSSINLVIKAESPEIKLLVDKLRAMRINEAKLSQIISQNKQTKATLEAMNTTESLALCGHMFVLQICFG